MIFRMISFIGASIIAFGAPIATPRKVASWRLELLLQPIDRDATPFAKLVPEPCSFPNRNDLNSKSPIESMRRAVSSGSPSTRSPFAVRPTLICSPRRSRPWKSECPMRDRKSPPPPTDPSAAISTTCKAASRFVSACALDCRGGPAS